jgi:hypothetical protein
MVRSPSDPGETVGAPSERSTLMTRSASNPVGRLRKQVLEAVVLLSSDLDDEAVVRQLIEDGCTGKQAWKLAILVPMAFARVAFRPAGVRFQEHFVIIKLVAGSVWQRRRRLMAEPAFREATRRARRLATPARLRGFYQVVRRSAEYAAIQSLRRQGSPLQKIQLSKAGVIAQ